MAQLVKHQNIEHVCVWVEIPSEALSVLLFAFLRWMRICFHLFLSLLCTLFTMTQPPSSVIVNWSGYSYGLMNFQHAFAQ